MVTDSDHPAICRTLLRRAGQGDTGAFAELYDRASKAVFGLVHSVLPDARLAEDITFEVYLHTWRTASRYDPRREDAFTLLMTTAFRHAINAIRNVGAGQGALAQPHVRASGCETEQGHHGGQFGQ
jgi:RNA polymerase sigma-70 factor (ECF subfamily)